MTASDYAAPPPPSVSIDNGSRPQEAVPTEQAGWPVLADRERLAFLIRCSIGECIIGPSQAYNAADFIISEGRDEPADGCSSNEGAALWAMHLRGPDDIYPAPDHATAQNWCDYVNDFVAQVGSDVEVIAAPVHWSGTDEAHAEGLPLAVAGWTLPDGHPALSILPQTEKGS